jgi:hypothetical protein
MHHSYPAIWQTHDRFLPTDQLRVIGISPSRSGEASTEEGSVVKQELGFPGPWCIVVNVRYSRMCLIDLSLEVFLRGNGPDPDQSLGDHVVKYLLSSCKCCIVCVFSCIASY